MRVLNNQQPVVPDLVERRRRGDDLLVIRVSAIVEEDIDVTDLAEEVLPELRC
ncbi:hypothetical protein [Arthrobacter sp. MW3 TE3886]|uniref:hypothetical protein n=1 Tax=Arthrobacter sp. MW3 TE3886 TaxID=3156254 RepID=UPI0035134EFC